MAHRAAINFLPLAFCCAFGVACGQQSDTADLKVTNGKATNAYPAVVNLDIKSGESETSCTGTFISDAVVLTAAHCFFRATGDSVRIGPTAALSYQRHPKYDYHVPGIPGLDHTETDIALVRFPTNTSRHFLSLTQVAESAGAEAVVVGFGFQRIFGSEAQTSKHEGVTIIVDRRDNRYIVQGSDGNHDAQSTDALAPNAQYSAIAPGDSGGPLLSSDGNRILGVASWTRTLSDDKGVAESVFNDVLGLESQAFLREFLPRFGL